MQCLQCHTISVFNPQRADATKTFSNNLEHLCNKKPGCYSIWSVGLNLSEGRSRKTQIPPKGPKAPPDKIVMSLAFCVSALNDPKLQPWRQKAIVRTPWAPSTSDRFRDSSSADVAVPSSVPAEDPKRIWRLR